MKALKIILIILGVLVLIGVIMGLVGPKSYQVERTALINASPEAVWPYVSSAQTFQRWSPWAKMDTTAKIEYFGTEGTVGSGFKWEGKKTGKGEQTYTVLEPAKTSNTHLKFYMPWGESETDSYINLEPDPGGTKITWGMKGENDFMGRMMGTMMNMEKAMGPHFEEGLTNLQTLITESANSMPAAKYEVRPADFPGMTYLGVRGDVKMSEMEAFYSKNLPAVMTELQKSGAQMDGMPTGLYYTWDMEKGMTTMVAAIGVKGNVKAPAGMEVINVPASKALMIKYVGGYYGIGGAHTAMDEYIKANQAEHVAPVIEEYVTDPGTEPDSNKWVTKITYLIK